MEPNSQMSNSGESRPVPAIYSVARSSSRLNLVGIQEPLLNLSSVRARLDSLQLFLSESIDNRALISKDEMNTVSSEIASAIHQVIINGAALLAWTPDSDVPVAGKATEPPDLKFSVNNPVISSTPDLKLEIKDEFELDSEVVELDAVELLAEHTHFCEICGKGFKRDANLRMHMRAHGNQFKTTEALAKPDKCLEQKQTRRFSCPFEGCNRNKKHKKFRSLKSVICVRNHFKRSHCPKMYSCNRCHKKSFSVLADLKSHLKHCGESKWKCSCGTTFSRKDKLFGHMALFEGHMPAVAEEKEKPRGLAAMEEDGEEDVVVKEGILRMNGSDDEFFDGLLDGFVSIESYCLQDVLGSLNGVGNGTGGVL